MIKHKILNALLILTSLIGYLEWGGNNQCFLFQAEIDILTKIFTDPKSMLHPLTVLPLVGQILLAVTLFQKQPSKVLTYCGTIGIALLLVLMLMIGLLAGNLKMVVFTLPFVITSFFTIKFIRSIRKIG